LKLFFFQTFSILLKRLHRFVKKESHRFFTSLPVYFVI
jgi:hypothetical protein